MEIRKFGWYRMRPLWKQNEVWRQQRTAMRETFESINSAANNALASAQNNLHTGLATLAAQASLERLQTAAAKQSQVDRLV